MNRNDLSAAEAFQLVHCEPGTIVEDITYGRRYRCEHGLLHIAIRNEIHELVGWHHVGDTPNAIQDPSSVDRFRVIVSGETERLLPLGLRTEALAKFYSKTVGLDPQRIARVLEEFARRLLAEVDERIKTAQGVK